MLQIRKKQFDILCRARQEGYRRRVYVHLQSVWPDELKTLQKDKVYEMIDTGIEKALRYRIESEMDIVKFIDCMIIWGADFDISPLTAWAAEILNNPTLRGSVKSLQLSHQSQIELSKMARQSAQQEGDYK